MLTFVGNDITYLSQISSDESMLCPRGSRDRVPAKILISEHTLELGLFPRTSTKNVTIPNRENRHFE